MTAASSAEPDLTAPFVSLPPAARPSPAPNAPKITLNSERFIARHMMLVRMIPDAPTSEPLMISTWLPSTKPVAQAARPE